MCFCEAFDKTKNDFCCESSLHGFKYVLAKWNRTLLERCVWWCVQIIALFCTVSLLLFSWNEFVDEPTVTILEDPHYPIANVPFPGISICDLNKISLKKVNAFAKEIVLQSNYSIDYIKETIKLIGKLYDYGGSVLNDDLLFQSQSFMNSFAHLANETSFNPYKTLKKLAPSCTDVLKNCSWNGVKYNCSDLFLPEITMQGFCCVFNYIPSRVSRNGTSLITKIIKENKNRLLRSSDLRGLKVVVHQNTDDYFYPLLSSSGAIVDIFNSYEFPDVTSGSLQQRLVPVGVEIFLKLTATVIYTMPEVKKYSVSKRKCIFPEESKTLLGKMYSRSDCLLDCRIKSMLALCQCVPFTYIMVFNGSRMPQCSLLDIPCLYKYQHKWSRLYPFDYEGDDMEADKQDSLQCNHCTSSCMNVWYSATNNYINIKSPRNMVTNYSVVHISFQNEYARLYKHDVVYYWFDIVSNLGGACSLTIGLSLISVAELLYFFIIKLFKRLWME